MLITRREDGTQFVVQAYRELLQPVKRSLLKSEIRMLAENHGEYVRLYTLPNDQIEAVFSREPGYLLGEAVWQYFGKPVNLIYCEALPENNTAIMVIVRNNSVYLDTKIPFTSISDELVSLATDHDQYDIYLSGNVPISDKKERGKFVIDQNLIKSFTLLEQPLFNTLPVNDALQLQPLEYALRTQKFGKPFSPRLLIIAAIAILLILGLWWFMHPKAPPVVVQPTKPIVQTDPYQAYKAALSASPAPTKQLAEFTNVVATVVLIAGWQATEVTFSNGSYTIPLNPMGGSLQALNQWANNRRFNMALNSQGVTLALQSTLTNRPAAATIYNAQQLVNVIVDRINRMMPERSVGFAAASNQLNFRTVTLNIELKAISPAVLNLIGRQLNNLPVIINSVHASLNQGLLSGSIQLSVLGN